jgi:hypothetical protein
VSFELKNVVTELLNSRSRVLVVAMKALTAAQSSLMAWEMIALLRSPLYVSLLRRRRALIREAEERCVTAESIQITTLDNERHKLHAWKEASWGVRICTVPRDAFIRDSGFSFFETYALYAVPLPSSSPGQHSQNYR